MSSKHNNESGKKNNFLSYKDNSSLFHLTISDENRSFWKYTKQHELRLQACSDCKTVRYPLFGTCFNCLSEKFYWSKMSGRGIVSSLIIYHKFFGWVGEEYARKIPYNVVEVQLEEGPRIPSNIVGICSNDEIKIGMEVKMVFEDRINGLSIPKFQPRQQKNMDQGHRSP